MKQDDGLGQQHRQHVAKRLWQDDEPHVLGVGHAQRLSRKHLAARDRLDARTHDLAEVGGLECNEGDDRRHLGTNGLADQEGNQQVKPENHHHQRDRAHAVDIHRGWCHQPALTRQPHEREQRAQRNASDSGHHGQLHAEQEAVQDKLAQHVQVKERQVQAQHLSALLRCQPR